jgi:hypothetical protein
VLLRSAEFCYTWVIPFHFPLTMQVTYLTIFTIGTVLHWQSAVPSSLGLTCGKSEWLLLTRIRVLLRRG